MSTKARYAVGIDLGTTHTAVASSLLGDPKPPSIFPIPQLVTPGEIEARELFPSCLYSPPEGEIEQDPFGDAPFVLGELARRRGAEVTGRLVASAKSWLSHAAVDRTAPILPWGAEGDDATVQRISPVEASARCLRHVRAAWDNAHPEAPLAEQDVVLTVPASFDDAARELTLTAARDAGLSVRLLEEPQAAFYCALSRGHDAGEDGLTLVCDVGGGTTDLSLFRVQKGEVERVAVGKHLLLGGDNMDLALAHLAEKALTEGGEPLDGARFGQLVTACRAAKEELLGEGAPASAKVTLLGKGARLLGSARSVVITREEAERVVLEGFFPMASRTDKPARARGGLIAFGLPYERDTAITRHVAAFFARHAEGETGPRALLLNGGVFRAKRVVERLTSAIEAWGGPPINVLPLDDPDLAVAKGAVVYALSRRGHGARIGGGSARGLYVGLDAGKGARQLVCVVPKGAPEGVPQRADMNRQRTFGLVVGRPVRFDLYATDELSHRAGEIVPFDDDHFEPLPPVATRFEPGDNAREVRVSLEGERSAIGTLELSCVEVLGAGDTGGVGAEGPLAEPEPPPRTAPPRRFRLAFQLRHDAAEAQATTARPPPMAARRLDEAREAIDRVFGKGRSDVAPRAAKDLVRDLERAVGPRAEWSMEVTRALFDALAPGVKARRRSADHERVFWMLAGYCLRPGFGAPGDRERAAVIAPLFAERLAFDETRNYEQLWIALRRVAGGLDEAAQTAIRDAIDPLIAPAEKRLKKPKGLRADAPNELCDMAASLERVAPARRSELGGWLLERTWTSRDPRIWAAIGRIGARVPSYASAHHVVTPLVAERWIDHLLREKWQDLPTAAEAASRLARLTGDRARDVSDRVRREVERRLVAASAPAPLIRAVREVVEVEDGYRASFFGDALPVGLKLVSA